MRQIVIISGKGGTGKISLSAALATMGEQLSEQMGVETILIDGPPGTGCPAISAMSGADLALLVTEPSRSGFHDLKRVKQLTDGFGIPSVVVINKYDLNEQVTAEIESWCHSEKLPLRQDPFRAGGGGGDATMPYGG
jgi:MinD superfamily P-loop ATPase